MPESFFFFLSLFLFIFVKFYKVKKESTFHHPQKPIISFLLIILQTKRSYGMMSQIQTEGTLNLRKFAGYMKKSVILALVVIFSVIIILIFGFFVDLYATYLLILGILFLAGIGLLIFQILQITFLYRAKKSASDHFLTLCFILRLAALTLLGLAIISFYAFYLPFLLIFISVVLNIVSYNVLMKFAEKNYSNHQKARQGFILFIISLLVGIGLSFLLLSAYDWTELILLGLGILLAVILVAVGLIMIANGFLEVFINKDSFGIPSSSPIDPIEPTFESYGAPISPSPPSSESTEDRLCKQCGTLFQDQATYCAHCGLIR
jgi:hypothetical protein